MPYKNKSDKVLSDRKHQQRLRKRLTYTLRGVLGGRCIKCFGVDKLQFHHKIPILRFTNNRYHITNLQISYQDFKKDPLSLILLCKDCHTEVHKNYDSK